MKVKNLILLIIFSFLIVTIVGCNTRHLKYSANDVTKIELYDLTNENQQLEKEITNQIEIKETLEEIEKITYRTYRSDIKAKSEYFIKIIFSNGNYNQIDPYRILTYKSSGEIISKKRFQCELETFMSLYNSIKNKH